MRIGQRRIVMLMLAAMLLGGMVWAPVAAADEPAWVWGGVYGAGYKFSNLPLSGANVNLWQVTGPTGTPPVYGFVDTGFTAMSIFDGSYTINVLLQGNPALPLYYTGGNYVIAANAVNYKTETDLNYYLPAGLFALNSFEMKPQSITLTVLPTAFTGVVKRGSKNLKGVKVAVAGKSVKTNSKGKWTISGMLLKPGAKYKVTYTKSGYKKVTKSYTSLPNATRNVGTVKMKRI